eukprot:CAMPEP_0174243692 /NCGR_PEP_ID=MMETSP0417-20130205/32515_1 /TAXON_ID=242541 /ORGANISM="Mayorella sp, Strain BSH-02190019" /LENGTH=115 /DNA_ID=CAMNT_0015323257 /DNA_START=45 /DNA_END=388 /DNA_ORIENTATION=-
MSTPWDEHINKLLVFVQRSFLVTQCCSHSLKTTTPKQELVKYFREHAWYDQIAYDDLKTAVRLVFKTLEDLCKDRPHIESSLGNIFIHAQLVFGQYKAHRHGLCNIELRQEKNRG